MAKSNKWGGCSTIWAIDW